MGTIDKNTGELRSTFDILQDLSKEWENLTSVEKQELTEVVARQDPKKLVFSPHDQFPDSHRCFY